MFVNSVNHLHRREQVHTQGREEDQVGDKGEAGRRNIMSKSIFFK